MIQTVLLYIQGKNTQFFPKFFYISLSDIPFACKTNTILQLYHMYNFVSRQKHLRLNTKNLIFLLFSLFYLKSEDCILRIPHREIGIPDIVVQIKIHILLARFNIVLQKSPTKRSCKAAVESFNYRLIIPYSFLNSTYQRASHNILRFYPHSHFIKLPFFFKAVKFEPKGLRKPRCFFLKPLELNIALIYFKPKIR